MQRLKRLLKQFRGLRISLSLKFIIGTAAVLTIAMSMSTYFVTKKDNSLIIKQLDMQAKALFHQIVLTRRWIADHGGVFVEQVPWEKPNPYLPEAAIVDIKGRKYNKLSPAMVTKELSKYARKEGMYWFHITSLKLLNPENAPDEFERRALEAFEAGQGMDFSKIEKIDSAYYYRYVAPLYIEEACLKCHSHQGYKTGDVRGAISVSVPMDYALSMMQSEKRAIILTSIATISILMIVLFIMMKGLVLSPVKQLKAFMKDFSRGEKTEISVIRTGDELEDLSSSFVEMAKSLTEYHAGLEDEVQKATKGLEDANARLTELNEKKSDFIAKISHELRTPMTSIKGAMDYITTRIPGISRSGKDAEDIMEFLDVIKNNADRLIRMVNDTLDLERIESGMFDLHFSRVNLISLVKEVIISFQSTTAERNITFKIVANPEVSAIADEDRIRQVLINLVSNALRYSPDNSRINIAVTESEKMVTVSIKDEGPGIPVEVQEKIFDKFYTIGKREGTGLGLAICKGVIEAHSGEIKVSSKAGERNNTFSFTLPKQGNMNDQ